VFAENIGVNTFGANTDGFGEVKTEASGVEESAGTKDTTIR